MQSSRNTSKSLNTDLFDTEWPDSEIKATDQQTASCYFILM